jgi:flagellar basal body-associated protein FliL
MSLSDEDIIRNREEVRNSQAKKEERVTIIAIVLFLASLGAAFALVWFIINKLFE